MGSTPRFEEITPGYASRRAPALEAYQGAQRKLWLWIGLAVFGVVVSLITYFVSGGGVVVVWLGPVVIGLIGAVRAAPEVRETRQNLDSIT